MARKSDQLQFGLGIAVLITILILGYMYYPVLNLGSGSALPTNLNQQGQLPPVKSSCKDYDIAQEYESYLGHQNFNLLAKGCTDSKAEWVAMPNEVSCHFNATTSIDCNQPSILVLKQFCTYMKATWVCSDTSKFVGCICNKAHPSTPLPSEAPSDEYTCGWSQQSWGMQCGGTCPGNEICSTFGTTECGCHDTSEQQSGCIGTIFVSSIKWTGAMGGLTGADNKCQVSANNAGLSGTWKAIMSDASISAASRLPDITYYNMDGLLVANNKADLFDGTLANFINIDENKMTVSNSHVWTGSNVDGTPCMGGDLGASCHNWGWVSEGYNGCVGDSGSNAVAWISDTTLDHCNIGNRIYCARVS